jgi:hypothetical protein
MIADRSIRASDQDRESAAELLSEAYAVGRLNRAELDERAAAAYSAKTWGELRDLTADLPPPALPPAARTGFPARRGSRRGELRLMALIIWSFVLPLGSGLAAPLSPVAVWVVTLVITTALLLGGNPAETSGRNPKASPGP